MKYLIIILLAFTFYSCQQSQKAQNIEKISIVACQDVKDVIQAYTGLIGNLISNLIKDQTQTQALCDCIVPIVKEHLNEGYQDQELDNMVINKQLRGKAIKKAIVQYKDKVLDCYKTKGVKGFEIIKKIIQNVL